jgi:hypothetical protein
LTPFEFLEEEQHAAPVSNRAGEAGCTASQPLISIALVGTRTEAFPK